MKFFDLVVFDLETTTSEENGYQQNNYIIDIGAVYLRFNQELSKFEEIDSFSALVKPEENISDFIKNLTGISNEMVADAPPFPGVISKFEEWVKSHSKNIKNVRLAAFGNYFDMPVLRKLYQKYGLNCPFSGTAIDVKTLGLLWLSLSGRAVAKASVEHIAKVMEIPPTGQYHRAIVDAIAEAKIVMRVFEDLSGGAFIKEKEGVPYSLIKLFKK